MLSAILKSLCQPTEDKFVSQVDKYLRDFCQDFEDNLRDTIKGHAMARTVRASIPVDFKIDDWNKAAEKSFKKLMNENPEGLEEIMKIVFDIKLKFDDADMIPSELLDIDIDMHEQDGHPIDYFDGFEGRPGHELFTQNCAQSGLSFRLYLEPAGDGEHANIAIVLWSNDQRPILSCVRAANVANTHHPDRER